MSGIEKVLAKEGEAAPFCALASNGNLVASRGGTFDTRKAIWAEEKEGETPVNIHSGEDE